MNKKYITAAEFDKRFEAGGELTEYLDLDHAICPDLE
jgi:hypothetical protein